MLQFSTTVTPKRRKELEYLRAEIKNDKNISPREESLFFYLWSFNKHYRHCVTSKLKLSEKFGVHPSTIYRWLNNLERFGYIRRTYQCVKNRASGKYQKFHFIKINTLRKMWDKRLHAVDKAKQYVKNFYTNAIGIFKTKDITKLYIQKAKKETKTARREEKSKKPAVIYRHDGKEYSPEEARKILKRAHNDELFCYLLDIYPTKTNIFGARVEYEKNCRAALEVELIALDVSARKKEDSWWKKGKIEPLWHYISKSRWNCRQKEKKACDEPTRRSECRVTVIPSHKETELMMRKYSEVKVNKQLGREQLKLLKAQLLRGR